MVAEGLYTIGVVSQMTNLSERQIRYYEQQGLVRPTRTPGGRRLFAKKDVSDLIRVKHLLAMGYSLSEIKARWGVGRAEPQATAGGSTVIAEAEDTREYSVPAGGQMAVKESSLGVSEEPISDREGCYRKESRPVGTAGGVVRVRRGRATAEPESPAQVRGIQGPAVTPAPPLGVRSLYPLRERPRIIEAVDLMRESEKSRRSGPGGDPGGTKKNGRLPHA